MIKSTLVKNVPSLEVIVKGGTDEHRTYLANAIEHCLNEFSWYEDVTYENKPPDALSWKDVQKQLSFDELTIMYRNQVTIRTLSPIEEKITDQIIFNRELKKVETEQANTRRSIEEMLEKETCPLDILYDTSLQQL